MFSERRCRLPQCKAAEAGTVNERLDDADIKTGCGEGAFGSGHHGPWTEPQGREVAGWGASMT